MRSRSEQQHSRGERLAVGSDQVAGLKQPTRVRMTDPLRVAGHAVVVERRDLSVGPRQRRFERGVASVVAQLHALVEGQPPIFVADAQKRLVTHRRVGLISGRHDDQK